MKLYVVMKKDDSGKWLPAHGREGQSFVHLRAFDNLTSAKRSMTGLSRTWPAEYMIVSFVEADDE